MENTVKSTRNFTFWAHLLLVLLAWAGPFLFDWRVLCSAYGLVLLQFLVLKQCILNKQHGINDSENNYTFYAELFEAMGFQLDRRRLKSVVRSWLYFALAAVAIAWQVGLGMKPLVF